MGRDRAQTQAVLDGQHRCLADLSQARSRIEELLKAGAATVACPTPVPGPARPEAEDSDALKPREVSINPEVVSWRVSAIEKFVPLTEEQRERLRMMFSGTGERGAERSDTLEEIIGAESAAFYRQQVQAAFKRAQEESVEKEVVWLSRQLGLSSASEQQVRQVFATVEQQLTEERRSLELKASSPRERVRMMIEENRRRRTLRNEQLKAVMAPEQFELFLRSQAESTDSDVEIFHGAG